MSEILLLEKARKYLLSKSPSDLALCYNFQDDSCTRKVRTIRSVLPVALALHSMSLFTDNMSNKERVWVDQVRRFIQSQSKNFSYSYWVRGWHSTTKIPIPDDLDDTSFSLSALLQSGNKIDEREILKAMTIESSQGGPYWTWYVPRTVKYDKWHDIDTAVNANFLYASALYGINLVSTRNYVLKKIRGGTFGSTYYPSDITTLYLFSRYAFVSDDKSCLVAIKKALLAKRFSKLSRIEKLLYLLTSAYLKMPVNKNQVSKFTFENLPFCFDFSSSVGKQTYMGSTVLTAALILELLAIRSKNSASVLKLHRAAEPSFIKTLKKKIHLALKLDLEHHKCLDVSYFTALSLKPSLTNRNLILLRNLSLGLFYSWSGYTILDEIVDGQRELEDHHKANQLVSEGNKYFKKIKNEGFNKALVRAFSESDLSFVDEALRNEGSSYHYIEKRMMPFLVCMEYLPELIGLSKSKGQSLYRIFKAQMIIDQLNDEAHDWKEDLRFKRITYVTSKLSGVDKTKFNSTFWNTIMPKIIKICTKEYQSAISEIRMLKTKNNFFNSIIESSYAPIRKASEAMGSTQRIIQSL